MSSRGKKLNRVLKDGSKSAWPGMGFSPDEEGVLARSVLDRIDDPLFWIASDGRIRYVNPAACRSLGYSREELLEMDVPDIDPQISRESWADNWMEFKRRGSMTFESLHRRKDGSDFPVEITANFIQVEDREFKCVFVRDISARKKREMSLASLYLISEATHRSRSLADLYKTIHEVITDLMPAQDNFYIALYDRDSDMLSFPYFVDEFEAPPPPEKAGRGLTEYVLRTGKSLLASPEVFRDLEQRGEVVSVGPPSIDWLGVPLNLEDRTIGVLVVQSYTEGSRFSQQDLEILTFISEQVAMAIERRRSEDALRASEQRFRSMVENAHDGIMIVGRDSHIVYLNDQLAKMSGYSPSELMGRDFRSYIHESSRELVDRRYLARQRGETLPSLYEINFLHKNGERRRIELSSSALRDSQDRIQILVHVRDITESRRMKKELKRSRERYKDLVEKADVAILIDNREGYVRYVNRTFSRIFGYSPKESEGMSIESLVHPEDRARVLRTHRERIRGRKVRRHYEFRGIRKDGMVIHCEVDAAPLVEEEDIAGTRSYIRDITHRKAADERLRASLQEKEILLREIHHRVKNNLQVISSLLNLQSRFIQDPLARDLFDESRRRVRSMAMVHEKLYRTENMARVDFGEYLDSLALSLFRTYGVNSNQVSLEIDVKDFYLDINTAIPCGLLVSELVSNCLKHAFPDERKGTVLVGMRKQEDGPIELMVRDDGIGLQPDIDLSGSQTFGMQLVEMLVEQLRGKMEIDRSGGTLFTIHFEPLNYTNKV